MICNLRSTALQLENQDFLLKTVLYKKVCDIIDNTKVKKLSVNEFAIYSSSCKGKACSVAKCQKCYKLNSRIRNKIRKKSSDETQTLPNINTRIYIICKNPSVLEKEIKRSRDEAKIHQRKLANVNLKRIMNKRAQGFSSSVDTKLVHRIFNEANSKVKSVLEEDSKQMESWKFHHEHLTSVSQNDGNGRRTRFDPVLMNWTIALLAKTSKSFYNDIEKVIQLPSASFVMRKTKGLVEKQGITGHQGINLFSIQTSSIN